MGFIRKIAWDESVLVKYYTIDTLTPLTSYIMDAVRIIAVDGGNHCTGIAVVDVMGLESDMSFKVIGLFLLENKGKKVKEPITNYLEEHVKAFLTSDNPVLVVYEDIHYNNWRVKTVNRTVKQFFKEKGVRVRVLQPSQKTGVSAKDDKKRKKEAEEAAATLLAETNPNWLNVFREIEPRRYDVADALLMAHYLAKHPTVLRNKMQ
jgi:hypothetical protein